MEKISVLFETQAGDKKIINFERSDIEDKDHPSEKQIKFFKELRKKSGFGYKDITKIRFSNGPETIESMTLFKFSNLKMIEIAEGTKILKWAFLGCRHGEEENPVSVILPNSLILDPVKRDDGSDIDPFFGCELKYVFIDNNPEIEKLIKERHQEAIIIHDRQKFDELVNNDSQDKKNIAVDNSENKSVSTGNKNDFENDDQKFEKFINNDSQDKKTKCLEAKNLVPVNKNHDKKNIKNKSIGKCESEQNKKNVSDRSYSYLDLLNIKSIFLPYFIYVLIIIIWHKIYDPACNNKIQIKNDETKRTSINKKMDEAKEKSDLNKQIPPYVKNKSNYNTEKGYF